MSRMSFLHVIIPLVSVILFFESHAAASADEIYGCAKDELVMQNNGKCPVCKMPLTLLREGYMYDKDKVLIDTLTKEEKEGLGARGDNRLAIVVYKSPTGEASFTPGADKNGAPLKREVIELKYFCGDMLSVNNISDKCKAAGDTPEALAKEREDAAAQKDKLIKEGEKRMAEESLRKSMEIEINDSWPIFYNKQKKAGMKDQEIQGLWEDEKKKVYEKYDYDPETDSFYNTETPQGGEK